MDIMIYDNTFFLLVKLLWIRRAIIAGEGIITFNAVHTKAVR